MRRILPGRDPQFPDVDDLTYTADGLYAIGGTLSPRTVMEAYRKGLFSWSGVKPYPWYSPEPRMVMRPSAFRLTKSLRKRLRQGRLVVRYDQDFRGVMEACGSTPRAHEEGTWITAHLVRVFEHLHREGVAHSVETYCRDTGQLVGGLYGLAVGRIFFGESMFARQTDASKVAFWDLCQRLDSAGYDLIDCQAETQHLRSLGAEPWSRTRYLEALASAWHGPDGWADAMATRVAQP